MAEFDTFIPGARDFLARLRAENTRDWFTAHKAEYDATIKDPAERLLAEMAPRLAAITGAEVKQKLFRPQRDIRFSKDKTPYKDHCHVLWHAPAGSSVGYFFGVSPDYLRIGAGVMEFSKGTLDAWRAMVAGPDGAALLAELAALEAEGFDVSEPQMKRVPAPYDKDDPAEALLRRKSLTVWADATEPVADLPGLLEARFTRFAPLCAMLARVA
ncbi:TIGR02453 family protein [Pseudooceanicola sp. LIPI14-2-Ac024]|uniref:TIGR02453 family protein n=1 Tax=Pseudooceanicola sp. LIPI14-2-Ac024 TaxID=3344875 RepID=UPI0035D0BE7C